MTALDLQPSLLDLIADDHLHADDRARIEAAIRAVAAERGEVTANDVRARLTGPHGLTVYPRVIGAVFSALVRSRVLRQVGWCENTDLASRNRGKPLRRYALTT